jgi:DNA replication protein DnaC
LREDVPVGHPNFGKLSLCICCLEEVEARRLSDLLNISNKESLSGKTFANFLPEGASPYLDHRLGLSNAYKTCKAFAENPSGRWLLLSGSYGCGKTHLAAAIANEMISQKKQVIFINVTDLLDHLRATFSPRSEETYTQRLEEIRNVPVLILDDLGTESPTAWAVEKLYQIINYRYNSKLPTVVTTNRNISRLDERIASRLQDVHFVTHLHILSPDFRSGNLRTTAGLYTLRPDPQYTFETFKEREDLIGESVRTFKKAVKEARKFAEEPRGWLIFIGGSGAGKTHLAASIANYRLQEGKSAIFVTFYDLLDLLHSGSEFRLDDDEDDTEPSGPSVYSVISKLRVADLLVLDDVPGTIKSPYLRSKLFQILLYRLETQAPTVLTTEAKLDKLDSRLASHLLHRDFCHFLLLTAPPYSTRNQKTLPNWYTMPKDKKEK